MSRETASQPDFKADGESWEDYAHRLETRIKNQRDQLEEVQKHMDEPTRRARSRINALERALGIKSLKMQNLYGGLEAVKRKHAADVDYFRGTAEEWKHTAQRLEEQLQTAERQRDLAQREAEMYKADRDSYDALLGHKMAERDGYMAKAEELQEQLETEARLRIKDCEDRNAYKREAALLKEQLEALQTAVDDGVLVFVDTKWFDAYHHLASNPAIVPDATDEDDRRGWEARREFDEANEWTPGNAHRDSSPASSPYTEAATGDGPMRKVLRGAQNQERSHD